MWILYDSWVSCFCGLYYLSWLKWSCLSAVETKPSSIMEVDSERTSELEDWEKCSIVLYSRHGMTTALITHRTCAYMQKACTKSRSLKIPAFVWGRLSPPPIWGANGSWWLLRDEESLLFGKGGYCRWPMFQWVFPYPWAYGQHYLDSVGYSYFNLFRYYSLI